jgi:hypothetical protein
MRTRLKCSNSYVGCKSNDLRFEVLTAVKMSMLVFWVVTLCGLVGRYQRFGEQTASIFRAEASEMMVSIGKSIHCYNPEDEH